MRAGCVLDAELQCGSRSVTVALLDEGLHLVEGGPVLHSVAQGCEHGGRIAGKVGGALRAEPATVRILHTTMPETLNQKMCMESSEGWWNFEFELNFEF